MMKITLFLVWIVITISSDTSSKTCLQLVQKIKNGKIDQDIAGLLPFVMYSGITSNNPGQKYQCEHAAGSLYNYYLVSWKNSTNNLEVFTGLCVPMICDKAEIEKALQLFSIKNSKVYDYPAETQTDGLFIASTVIVGIWASVLTLWSIVISCKAPLQNELIKKNEQIKQKDDNENPINSISSNPIETKQDFKMFNFYEGYARIFQRKSKRNIIAPILFLAILNLSMSIQFSFRQNIAANELKSLKWFNSFGGVVFANLQITFNVIIFALGVKLAYSLYKLNSFHEIGRFFFDELLTKWLTLFLVSLTAYFLIGLTDEPLNQLWNNQATADCPSVIYQIWFLFRGLQFDGKTCLPWLWILEADIILSILAAPFYIIYKTKKSFGLILFGLLVMTSMFVGFAVLDNQSILFQPYKLFNTSRDFIINYQSNSVVRMAPYFIGLIFGLLINEGIEKAHDEKEGHSLVKIVRRNQKVQIGLHLGGFGIMLAMSLLIIPYLALVQPDESRKQAYAYLIFAPFGFLVGLIFFLTPCYWQGENKLTVLISKALHAGLWDSLDKMAIGFIGVAPVIIGFTTYSMQNSIFFDFETVFIYFLGDSVIIFICSILIVAGIVHQLQFFSKWLQSKLFNTTSKYSVLILED